MEIFRGQYLFTPYTRTGFDPKAFTYTKLYPTTSWQLSFLIKWCWGLGGGVNPWCPTQAGHANANAMMDREAKSKSWTLSWTEKYPFTQTHHHFTDENIFYSHDSGPSPSTLLKLYCLPAVIVIYSSIACPIQSLVFLLVKHRLETKNCSKTRYQQKYTKASQVYTQVQITLIKVKNKIKLSAAFFRIFTLVKRSGINSPHTFHSASSNSKPSVFYGTMPSLVTRLSTVQNVPQ